MLVIASTAAACLAAKPLTERLGVGVGVALSKAAI
jgi:hypothetical protein